jgi:hypothetical protein
MRALFLTIVLLVGAVASAAAQWHLGLELATIKYHGSSRDSSASHVISEGGPAGGLALGITVGRNWRRLSSSIRISYANAGFGVAGNDMSIVDKTTGTLAEAALLVGTRVGGIGPSGAIRVELGPALHLWDFDSESRTRAGVIGATSYEWPVSSRFTGAIRLEGMLSPSWFNASELPPEFERQATWRYGWGIGLRYRLT